MYVDIVCSFNGIPVWILVSDRNPKYNDFKELRDRILVVLIAARKSSLTVRPSSVILFFSSGLRDDVVQMLHDEFGTVEFHGFRDCSSLEHEFKDEEGDWVFVEPCRSFQRACFLEIKIEAFHPSVEVLDSKINLQCKNSFKDCEMDINSPMKLGDSFISLLSQMRSWSAGDVEDDAELVNFDTTTLVAAVSGISSGAAMNILDIPESDLRARFKGTYDCLLNEVYSEMKSPIHTVMGNLIHGRRGIVCETVVKQFQGVVSMGGGSGEKLRAQHLLKKLKVVPDCPSPRISSLPTTRHLALKNKVAFGTGDHWHAPTITSNMAFVRAVSQTGMSLFTLEHRTVALVGD